MVMCSEPNYLKIKLKIQCCIFESVLPYKRCFAGPWGACLLRVGIYAKKALVPLKSAPYSLSLPSLFFLALRFLPQGNSSSFFLDNVQILVLPLTPAPSATVPTPENSTPSNAPDAKIGFTLSAQD